MRELVLSIVMLLTAVNCMSASTDFEEALAKHGIVKSECKDLSGNAKIKFGKPTCAYINIDITSLPTQKGSDKNATLEMYDGNGNYLKLPIVIDVQGNSSTRYVKKNFAIDFFTTEERTESPDITIGNWVAQDGFHLKAYYLDYFRGTANVAYQLFDDIIADHESYQERAGLSKITAARCYPDAFPCIVYKQGEFYGIYSFQLKKHRKNMNLNKSTAENIHLDGEMSDQTFFKGNIDWTLFEVRNPKTLYSFKKGWFSTVTIIEYDGDNPTELIGTDTKGYDSKNEGHVLTAKTKEYITKLSKYCAELDNLINRKASNEQIRQEIDKRFDVKGMIDYMVHAVVVNNYDGFRKNWQWFTYDGTKWFVAPYDLDGTFGNYWDGSLIMDADKVTVELVNYQEFDHFGMFTRKPFTYMEKYFHTELLDRYKQLRNNGVLTKENILNKLNAWTESIGEDNYNMEWKRWPDSPCIKRYSDGIDRISGWIDKRLSMADEYAGFVPTAISITEVIPQAVYTEIYTIDGRRTNNFQRGINVVRTNDGNVRKIIQR